MLAEKIGKQLKGGEVIELISDVGGGKTTFVRGLVRGAGSQDRVASPTFTINRVYKAPKFEIKHYDFYRMHESGLMEHELAEALQDTHAVVVMEWSDVVQHVLPGKRMQIGITPTSEDARQLHFTYSTSLAYLLRGL